MREARPAARVAAENASGWRIEGILREFPTVKPRRCYYRWPVHLPDDGLLADAVAEGEKFKRREKAIEAKQNTIAADTSMAYETLAQSNEKVTISMLAEDQDITERAMRKRLTQHGPTMGLICENGQVVRRK